MATFLQENDILVLVCENENKMANLSAEVAMSVVLRRCREIISLCRYLSICVLDHIRAVRTVKCTRLQTEIL